MLVCVLHCAQCMYTLQLHYTASSAHAIVSSCYPVLAQCTCYEVLSKQSTSQNSYHHVLAHSICTVVSKQKSDAPVAVTTAQAAPPVTIVPLNTVLVLLLMLLSAGTASVLLLTAALSPVREASSVLKVVVFSASSRASAAICTKYVCVLIKSCDSDRSEMVLHCTATQSTVVQCYSIP
jgi:hypothetical protein